MTDNKEPSKIEPDKKTEATTPPVKKQAKTPKITKDKPVTQKEEKKNKPQLTPKEKWSILKYPHLSEKSIANIELQNKIVFIVKSSSKRTEVKKAVETMFDVKVEKVNMLTTTKGHKKALVRLKPDYSALDIATRLGMM